MARPHKTGLDYFPHDVDLSNDEKIESIEAIYGNDGYAVYLKLLERIYRNGGELKISDAETIKILSKKCNVDIKRFESIIEYLVKFGLFSLKKYKKKILTSSGIKTRIKLVFEKRKRALQKYQSRISNTETALKISNAEIPAETRQKFGRNTAETRQNSLKVKKSKVKKSKVKYITPLTPLKQGGIDFFENLIPQNLKTEKFISTWREWLKHRKEIRHPVKQTTAKKQLEFLAKQPDPIACIENSIKHGWQGLFEVQAVKQNHPKAEKGKYDKYG
jgi:predicted transcriptional regulator